MQEIPTKTLPVAELGTERLQLSDLSPDPDNHSTCISRDVCGKWSAFEKSVLKEMYPANNVDVIAKRLDRSWNSVMGAAKQLKLSKSDDVYFLRDKEVVDLWQTGRYKRRELAKMTGLADGVIRGILSRRKAKTRQQVVLMLARQMYANGKTEKEIAGHFGRNLVYIKHILMRQRTDSERQCCHCGKPYTGRASLQYCSEECQKQAKPHSKKCPICGIQFHANRSTIRFCSYKCRDIYRQLGTISRDLEIRKLRRSGHSSDELSNKYSLTPETVYAVLRGRNPYIDDIEKYRRHGRRRDITAFARTERLLAKKNLQRAGIWFWVQNNLYGLAGD